MKALSIFCTATALGIMLFAAMPSNAHAARGGIKQRFAQAIGQGVLSGALTPNEVQDLRRQIDGLRAQAQSYRADGIFSETERSQLRTAVKSVRERLREFRNNNVRVS
jgi:hypothetical protein